MYGKLFQTYISLPSVHKKPKLLEPLNSPTVIALFELYGIACDSSR